MARVMAVTVFTPGHVYPFMSTLLELRRRGHAVLLVALSSSDTFPADVDGVPVHGVRWPAPVPITDVQSRTAAERVWLHNLALFGEPAADLFDEVGRVHQPDLAVLDPMLWGAMVAAEASGLPWASLSHNPMSIRGRGLDVRGPGLPPPRSALERLRHRLVDVRQRWTGVASLRMVNALRARYGLAGLADFRDRHLTPPLTIAATAEPFEYPRDDWPASLAFVGPLVWEPAQVAPDWLGELDERPILLITGSTVPEYSQSSAWMGVVLEALAGPDWQIIVTLPAGHGPRGVPGSVRVVPFVPHGLLLPRTACVICHGGYGITTKALAQGIPVVAVPGALDRFEVARRVDVAGAGVMVPERKLSHGRVRTAVRLALGCAAGARRVAEAFGRAGGPAAAADALAILSSAYLTAPIPPRATGSVRIGERLPEREAAAAP